jgi:cytochrome b6-f complex iron-sulfur subunit
MDENNSSPLEPEPSEKGMTRGSFLRKIWWGAVGVAGLELVGGLVSSLKPHIAAGSFGTKVSVATVEEIQAMPVGTVSYYIDQRLYISKVEANGILVMYRKCTHLGCVVPWVPGDPSDDNLAKTGRFHCPCHGGQYDRYGVVHAGPPPRPLDLFAVSIDGDEVVVDTGKIISRSKFDESQITKV